MRLRIPPLTQNGQVFRLKGYGMPKIGHPQDKGDLYARVEAQLPSAISPAEREHWEALAKLTGATQGAQRRMRRNSRKDRAAR